MSELFKPLKGIKVIEFATVLAGPAVGMFLSELGAEVIKIEPKKTKGDVTRSWKLKTEDPQHPFSAYYSCVNFGKESIFIDLRNHKELEQCQQMIQSADIVLSNFKTKDAEKYGLDFNQLKQLNRSIILSEIKGFNDSDRLAYDLVLQAETGMLSINGLDQQTLCKLPIAFIDLFAAHQLKEGILLALLQRERTKRAYKVSVSLYDAAISALANQGSNWYMGGHNPSPLGMLHPNIAPYGETFQTKDKKWLVLAIGNNTQFEQLAHVLGLEELMNHPDFTNNQNRVKNRVKLQGILKEKIVAKNLEVLQNLFEKKGIPAGYIRSIKEVFDRAEVKKKIRSEKKEGHILKSYPSVAFKLTE